MTTYVLNVPYEIRGAVSKYGATWDKNLGFYKYVGDTLPQELEDYSNEDYSWERWIEDTLNKKIRPVKKGTTFFTPRDYQLTAGKKIGAFIKAGAPGFLENDEVGTGKTISVLLGAAAYAKIHGFTPSKPLKLLILCTNPSIPHWRNTLRSLAFSPYFRVTIINYERINKLLTVPTQAKAAKKKSTKNRNTSKSGTSKIPWNVVIVDESHKLKNFTSQRAQAFENIAKGPTAAKAPFVIYATATIGQNPVEVGYMAPLFGWANKTRLTRMNWGPWLKKKNFHVAKGKAGWAWVRAAYDKSNLTEVKVLQKEDVLRIREYTSSVSFPSIRRLPEDLKDYPKMQRIPIPVDLNFSQRKLYRDTWTEFREFLNMSRRNKDSRSSLVQQLRFRQKSSLLLVDGAVDFILELLEKEQQVAVSTEFIETLDAIKEKLRKSGYECSEFSGRNSALREQDRIAFQKGHNKVILYTVKESVSFHANEILHDGTTATPHRRANVIIDPRYSSLEMSQIEGRTHRDGQFSCSYYLYANNTVQQDVIEISLERMANMRSMSGDSTSLVEEIESLLFKRAEV